MKDKIEQANVSQENVKSLVILKQELCETLESLESKREQLLKIENKIEHHLKNKKLIIEKNKLIGSIADLNSKKDLLRQQILVIEAKQKEELNKEVKKLEPKKPQIVNQRKKTKHNKSKQTVEVSKIIEEEPVNSKISEFFKVAGGICFAYIWIEIKSFFTNEPFACTVNNFILGSGFSFMGIELGNKIATRLTKLLNDFNTLKNTLPIENNQVQEEQEEALYSSELDSSSNSNSEQLTNNNFEFKEEFSF